MAYPIEITEKRNSIEGNFIFCVYKDIQLLDNYIDDIKEERDFKTDEGKFYISIALELYKRGIRSITDVSIRSFLEHKDSLLKSYEDMGGFQTINQLKRILDVENAEAYWDELSKSNILYKMHDSGFDVVKDIEKINKMDSEQIYDFYDHKLNTIFTNTSSTMIIEDMRVDNTFVESCDSGQAMGLNYSEHMPRLNYATLGVPLGELYMIAATSGGGKTSLLWFGYLMPFIRQGYKVVLVSNEQTIKNFKALLLVEALTKDLKYFGITRKKLKIGGFTDEQRSKIKEAQKIIDEKYYKKIKFVKMFNYSISSVKKIVKRYSKSGYSAIAYDTLKYDGSSNSNSTWEGLLEDSKSLFQVASKENVALITTFQLALHTINKRYLDASCLSNGKQIKEVYSEMVYFREMWDDEYSNEKFDVKPYNFLKQNGKYTKIKETITLDPDKRHLISFLDKTRNDETGICIVYEHIGHFNIWKEIGFCTVYHDR